MIESGFGVRGYWSHCLAAAPVPSVGCFLCCCKVQCRGAPEGGQSFLIGHSWGSSLLLWPLAGQGQISRNILWKFVVKNWPMFYIHVIWNCLSHACTCAILQYTLDTNKICINFQYQCTNVFKTLKYILQDVLILTFNIEKQACIFLISAPMDRIASGSVSVR